MHLWFIGALVLLLAGLALWLLQEPRTRGIPFRGKLPGNALIVVFSDSPCQNTRRLAVWLHEATGAPILPLQVKDPYPGGYWRTVARARRELKAGTTPELSRECQVDLSPYQVVFLGSPVWWGQGAPPVRRFLQEHGGLAGKEVVPFATHGGGGVAGTFRLWRKECPQARFREGLSLRGSSLPERIAGRTLADHCSPDLVAQWLNRLYPSPDDAPGEGRGGAPSPDFPPFP